MIRLSGGLAAVLLLSLYTFNTRGSGVLNEIGSLDGAANPRAAVVGPEAVGGQAMVPSPAEDVPADAVPPEPGGTSVPESDPAQPDTPPPTSPATVEPTPPPEGTPSPTLLPPTVVLEGISSGNLAFSHPGGSVRVLSEATSPSIAGCTLSPTVLAYDTSAATAVIFLVGSGSDQGWVDLVLEPGTYQMVIDTDCVWRVTVAQN
ncbi:MAG: hypothetical protein ACRDGJ_12565 [Candidatus Limnocylindria bacterium]